MALLDYLELQQTAPMHVREGSSPDRDMSERYRWFRAGQRMNARQNTERPARMADSCFINYLDADGNSQWRVVTIETWREFGGKVE